MRYEKAKKLKAGEFKRLCGVKKETFMEMCEIAQAVEKRERRGRKPKLSVEEQVLLTLSFWREYRTMFHLGQDWGINESNVSRLVRKPRAGRSEIRTAPRWSLLRPLTYCDKPVRRNRSAYRGSERSGSRFGSILKRVAKAGWRCCQAFSSQTKACS